MRKHITNEDDFKISATHLLTVQCCRDYAISLKGKRKYVLVGTVILLQRLVNGMGTHFLFPKHLIHYMNKCLCGHKFNQ